MLVLTIRTDKPEAEIGLYDGQSQLAYESWHAHRQLAETLHTKITELLASSTMQLSDIQGIVCYKGPGSFTGLRIGLTTANALAYSFNIPIIAQGEENWQALGIEGLQHGKNEQAVSPEYGAPVHITQQKK